MSEMVSPEEMLKQQQDEGRKSKKDQAEEERVSPVTSFELDVEDSRGVRWQGRFTYKVPNLGEQVSIARLKTAYLPQGSQADAHGELVNEMTCYLAVTLQDKPDWWDPYKFYDLTPLRDVYAKCREHENLFLGRNVDGGSRSGGVAEEGDTARSEDVRGSDVDEDVQPSRKRREVLTSDPAGSSGASSSQASG